MANAVNIRTPFVIVATCTSISTAATVSLILTAIRPFTIYDIHNSCTTSDANSTVQVSRDPLGGGSYAVVTSAALAIVTANAIVRTTTIVAAQRAVVALDLIKTVFTCGTSGTAINLGENYIHIYVTPIPGQ